MSDLTKYRFDANGYFFPAYNWSIPGDNSVEFYVAADVDAEIAMLRAENQALREALEAVEWSLPKIVSQDGMAIWFYFCPLCLMPKYGGEHELHCKLNNALKKARGE